MLVHVFLSFRESQAGCFPMLNQATLTTTQTQALYFHTKLVSFSHLTEIWQAFPRTLNYLFQTILLTSFTYLSLRGLKRWNGIFFCISFSLLSLLLKGFRSVCWWRKVPSSCFHAGSYLQDANKQLTQTARLSSSGPLCLNELHVRLNAVKTY